MTFRSGFVTILGRPNVGKSTLLNTLVGQKVAIVTDKPQTTRSRILGICHRADAQIVFVDTPGIHKPQHRLNRKMVEVSFSEAAANDVNLVMAAAPDGIGAGDRFAIARARAAGKPLVLVLNMIDLMSRPRLLPLIASCRDLASWKHIVPLSARTGENVEALVEALKAEIPEGPPLFPDDQVTDQLERTIAAELVREQVLHLTRDEIPFSTAVTVERWEEKTDASGQPLAVIDAVVWVERDSQKGIVVGKGGRLVRDIGQRARAQIEPMLGRRVYLELQVKVRENWREDRSFLERLFPREDDRSATGASPDGATSTPR